MIMFVCFRNMASLTKFQIFFDCLKNYLEFSQTCHIPRTEQHNHYFHTDIPLWLKNNFKLKFKKFQYRRRVKIGGQLEYSLDKAEFWLIKRLKSTGVDFETCCISNWSAGYVRVWRFSDFLIGLRQIFVQGRLVLILKVVFMLTWDSFLATKGSYSGKLVYK